jgi:hypothetical protein
MFTNPDPCSNIVFITSPYKSIERQIFIITLKTNYYIALFKIWEPMKPFFYVPWLCDAPVTKTAWIQEL